MAVMRAVANSDPAHRVRCVLSEHIHEVGDEEQVDGREDGAGDRAQGGVGEREVGAVDRDDHVRHVVADLVGHAEILEKLRDLARARG